MRRLLVVILTLFLFAVIPVGAQELTRREAIEKGYFVTIESFDHGKLTATAGDVRYELECLGSSGSSVSQEPLTAQECYSGLRQFVGQKVLTSKAPPLGDNKLIAWVTPSGDSWYFRSYSRQHSYKEVWTVVSAKPIKAARQTDAKY